MKTIILFLIVGACVVPLSAAGVHMTATVVRVIDGDTVVVALRSGKTENVRFIGVDTPETKAEWLSERNGKKVPQHFGPEAAAFVAHVLKKKKSVTLTLDGRHNKWDKYHRLLAYVKVPMRKGEYDDYLQKTMGCGPRRSCPSVIDLNLELNRLGFSRCYKKFKHPRLKEFLSACRLAKKNHVGKYQ